MTSVCQCGHEVTDKAFKGGEAEVQSLRALQICHDCKAANKAAAAALRAECEAKGTRCYLRYGKPPASGYSANGMTGGCEAGVSVYPAWRLPGRRYVMDLDDCCFSAVWLSNRPVYTVTGTLLDEKGSDGEPLLADVTARKLPGSAVVDWLI